MDDATAEGLVAWRSDLLQTLPPPLSLRIRSRFGFSREPEMELLPMFVGPGDTVLDVGAHLGIYAHRMARLVGSGGRVVCVEPQPLLATYLRKAFADAHNVEIHEAALSDEPGERVLSLPVEGGRRPNRGKASLEPVTGPARPISVPVTTLDTLDLGRGRLTFVKIDVEGHELPMLRGATRTIGEHRPVLLIEIERRHAHEKADTTFDHLGALGYGCLYLDPVASVLRPLHDRRVLARRPVDAPSSRAYVNNFLFVPGDLERG